MLPSFLFLHIVLYITSPLFLYCHLPVNFTCIVSSSSRGMGFMHFFLSCGCILIFLTSLPFDNLMENMSLFHKKESIWKHTHVFHISRKWKKVKSEVAQSCLTLYDPMNCSPPGSCIHGIFQARILQWVANPSPISRKIFWNPWGDMDSRIVYPGLVFNKHPWIEQEFNKCFLTDLTIGNQVILLV